MKITEEFFEATIPGYEGIEQAKEYARGLDWTEVDYNEQTIQNIQYEDTVNGIDIYYCFGTDEYLFAASLMGLTCRNGKEWDECNCC